MEFESKVVMEDLLFLPLGGVGEFGANVALYGYNDKWLMVDCGISFADDSMPGIEILAPDLSYISSQKEKLVGLVLTHAHEDHLGAVAYVWDQLNCPVFATPYTASILRNKLSETGLLHKVPLKVVDIGGSIELDPFKITYVPVAHSILEANSLAITTPAGVVIHSGDWKLDDQPCIGPRTEENTMRSLGDRGVLALFGDSTNALTDGQSGSEGELRESIINIVSKCKGRVAITQFASNAARIESAFIAAKKNDREVVVVGRSLRRTINAAQECGYLEDIPPLLEEEEAELLPSRNTLLLLTGCQGEKRGAMSRVAFGQHRNIRLSQGDTAIFSSKSIPGNEHDINRVTSQLVRLGAEVITYRDAFVHVSGHPARNELSKLIEWLKPKIVVPVHGELANLRAHSDLALEKGNAQTAVIENGSILRLSKETTKVIDRVDVGKFAITSSGLAALDSPGLQERRRMMFNGVVAIFLILDTNGNLIAQPSLVIRGLDFEMDNLKIVEVISERVKDLPRPRRMIDGQLELGIRQVLRKELRQFTGQRPLINIEIIRLKDEKLEIGIESKQAGGST